MQPLEPDDPRQIGEYRLLQQLGAGGMGRVYLGRTAGGRTVAVKVVRRELAGDSEFRARFRQEVAAARRVGGAWTAPVLDADTEGTVPWVATGFVAGPSLEAAVRVHGPLPEPSVHLLGVGIAEALAHVHGLGLVHRDIKPSNVLLTLDGPRLIDFGIARALDATGVLTGTGQVIGSPGYMSPEQANGRAAGPASDVFTLGSVLAFAATGVPPFGSEVSVAVLLYRVLHEQPDLSGLADPLRSVVRACLAKNPAARPSPQQLRAWLDTDGTAASRLGQGGWLPVGLSAAVGRSAVGLLGLDADPGGGWADQAAAGAPPLPHAAPTVTAPGRPGGTPASPGSGPDGPEPSRRGRGWKAVAAAVGAVLLLASGGYAVKQLGDGGTPAGTAASAGQTPAADKAAGIAGQSGSDTVGRTPAADPTPTPTPRSAEPNDVPQAFLGTWHGETKQADGSTTRVSVTVGISVVGDAHSSRSRTDADNGEWCERALTLVSASATQLSFTAQVVASSDSRNCHQGDRVLELQRNGTVRYTSSGASGETTIVMRKVA